MQEIETELEVMQLSQRLQRGTTELLKRHRRMVAANKLLPKATREQRDVALRGRSDEELLAATKKAGPGTVARYQTRAASAFEDARVTGVSVWSLVEQKSGNVDSWYTFKAGVQHYLEEETVRAKRLLDQWQRERRLKGPSPESSKAGARLMNRLAALGGALQQVPAEAPERFKGDGKSKRYAKNSKSTSIRTAAEDWRERAADAMEEDLRLLFLVQCVTGCRPQELANGVQVRLLPDGTLVTRVKGAKTDEVAGQPNRAMRLSASAGIARKLAALLDVGVTLDSRSCDVGLVNTYGKKVSRACARAFPERKGRMRFSAYSVRHQLKADLLADGWSPEEIAMAMGHSTVRSGTAYGRGGRGGGGGVKPLAIKALRPVKLRGQYPKAKAIALAATTGDGGTSPARKSRPKP